MEDTWMSPEAKVAYDYVQRLLVDRQGQLTGYLPLLVSDWNPIKKLNVGGRVAACITEVTLSGFEETYSLVLRLKKSGIHWEVSLFTLLDKNRRIVMRNILNPNNIQYKNARDKAEYQFRNREFCTLVNQGANMTLCIFLDSRSLDEEFHPNHLYYSVVVLEDHEGQTLPFPLLESALGEKFTPTFHKSNMEFRFCNVSDIIKWFRIYFGNQFTSVNLIKVTEASSDNGWERQRELYKKVTDPVEDPFDIRQYTLEQYGHYQPHAKQDTVYFRVYTSEIVDVHFQPEIYVSLQKTGEHKYPALLSLEGFLHRLYGGLLVYQTDCVFSYYTADQWANADWLDWETVFNHFPEFRPYDFSFKRPSGQRIIYAGGCIAANDRSFEVANGLKISFDCSRPNGTEVVVNGEKVWIPSQLSDHGYGFTIRVMPHKFDKKLPKYGNCVRGEGYEIYLIDESLVEIRVWSSVNVATLNKAIADLESEE